MTSLKYIFGLFLLLLSLNANSQADTLDNTTVDIVILDNGSRLRGKILNWDYEKGMNFQLASGATVFIPREDILRVSQETPQRPYDRVFRERREPRPYAFREEGWYQNTSGFFHISAFGGAGIHHAMGYRFNRMFGVGLGTGIETHDFNWVRHIVPIYAEARGFLFPKKITPYYALKIGWGIGLNDPENGTTNAKGGFHFSPELGVRFGAGDVSYYLGLEYKLQNATFTTNNEWWGGGISTDVISYRRIEMRTGLLF